MPAPEVIDLEFRLRPSQIWRRLQLVVTVTVGLLLIFLPLAVLQKALLLLIVVLAFIVAGQARQRFYRFTRLVQQGGTWYLRGSYDGNQSRRCRVEYISSLVIVLRTLTEDQNRSSLVRAGCVRAWFTRGGVKATRLSVFRLPVFKDAMQAEDFQKLQLLVRNGWD